MLIQSHLSEIRILPAIPQEWKNGSFKGLKARGGFEVNVYWINKLPVKVAIKSMLGKDCVLISSQALRLDGTTQISEKQGTLFVLKFKTEHGKTYQFNK